MLLRPRGPKAALVPWCRELLFTGTGASLRQCFGLTESLGASKGPLRTQGLPGTTGEKLGLTRTLRSFQRPPLKS